MRITPFKQQVLVRKIVCSDSDHYGQTTLIKVPDDFQRELKFCGEVLGCGSQVHEGLQPGDIVLLDAYGEYSWETDADTDGELAFVPIDDVLAVLDRKPEYLSIVMEDARQVDEVV